MENNNNKDRLKDPSASQFSLEVIELAESSKTMGLLDALVNICDKYDVPYEEVCSFNRELELFHSSLFSNNNKKVVMEETVNLITQDLKERLHSECRSMGLIKGTHVNNSLI